MKNKKFIFVLLLLMLVGFASVSTTLFINGTTSITSNEDDFKDGVIFSKVSAAEKSGNEVGGTATIVDDTTISFNTGDLTKVGNTATVNFTVSNLSTQYDAELTLDCTSTDANYDTYVKVTKNLVSNKVVSASTVDGSISVELIKSALQQDSDEVDIDFTCTITATAVEIED